METYKLQIDDLVREATEDEITKIKAQQAKATASLEALEEKKIARYAVLAKLGLSVEEAAALLG